MVNLISSLVDFAQNITVSFGYAGIFFVAALENFLPFIPSELTFPFAGFVAGRGNFQLFPAIIAGVLGALAGAWFLFGLGYFLGRANIKRFLDRYGKFLQVHFSDVEAAEKWFMRFEGPAVFFGRLVPLVRVLISIPAGFVKMPFWRFSIYSFTGSFIWIGFLSLAGFLLGENWPKVVPLINDYEFVGGILIALAIVGFGFWFLRHHHR